MSVTTSSETGSAFGVLYGGTTHTLIMRNYS